MRRKQFLYVIITYFINDVKIKLLFTQLIYIFTISENIPNTRREYTSMISGVKLPSTDAMGIRRRDIPDAHNFINE